MRGLLLLASLVIGGMVVVVANVSLAPTTIDFSSAVLWSVLQYIAFLCVVAFFMIVAYRIMRAVESMAGSAERTAAAAEGRGRDRDTTSE